jgi:hypothetical protein
LIFSDQRLHAAPDSLYDFQIAHILKKQKGTSPFPSHSLQVQR